MSEEGSNTASEAMRYAVAFLSETGTADEELVRSALTDDFAYEDRRSGPSFPDADAESFPKILESLWQTGADGRPRSDSETLAVRGERFAAVVVRTDYGNGMLTGAILVVGLDATLRKLQREVDFDIDDVDGAIDELDRLHCAADAS